MIIGIWWIALITKNSIVGHWYCSPQWIKWWVPLLHLVLEGLHNLISCIIAHSTCMWFLCYADTWWEWSGCYSKELTTVGHDCQVNLKSWCPLTSRSGVNTLLLNTLWVHNVVCNYMYVVEIIFSFSDSLWLSKCSYLLTIKAQL